MLVILKIESSNVFYWRRVFALVLTSALVFMLIVGLRPYASYSDEWVSFNNVGGYTEFGHFGLAVGEIDKDISTALAKQSVDISLSVELIEPSDNRFQLIAQIYAPGSTNPLILGQWRTYFIAMSGTDFRNDYDYPRVAADLSTHMGEFAQIKVVLNPDNMELIVDGQQLDVGKAVPFIQAPSKVTIGNAPNGRHGWTGKLKSFAFSDNLGIQMEQRYLFNENNLPLIEANGDESKNLTIPDPGAFPIRDWIGTLRLSQMLTTNIHDVAINFVGFLPFGLFVWISLLLNLNSQSVWKAHKGLSVLFVSACGLLFSFSIELLQAYIPGRSPHLHDIVLNTLGAAAGAVSAYVAYKIGLIAVSEDSTHLKSIQ